MRRIFLFIPSVLMLASCGTQEPESPADPNDGRPTAGFTVTDSLPKGTFADSGSGYSGDLFVRGYADITTVNEPFCMENCQQFKYVFFNIMETGNDSLRDFLPQNEGNAYVGPSSIGLGCLEGTTIRYANHSDEFQMREFTIDENSTDVILEAEEENPIALSLSKSMLSGGSEAPACYSHFTEIEVSDVD